MTWTRASRDPPADFNESDFERATVGESRIPEPAPGKKGDPLIVLYWTRRPGEDRHLSKAKITDWNDAQKPYDEAVAPARKAYDEAVASAWKAYDEAVAAALKAYNKAVASAQETLDYAKLQYAFDPPSTRYVIYRQDEDKWVETDDADEARGLVSYVLADLREERKRLGTEVERARDWAKKGVKLARFDPGKVFVRRHWRSRR